MNRFALSFLTFMTMVACVMESSGGSGDGSVQEVLFEVRVSGETRSSVSPYESAVDKLCLVVYRAGCLYDVAVFDEPDKASLVLDVGRTYHVYALANSGAGTPPADEEDFLADFSVEIAGIEDLDDYLPMASGCVSVTVEKDMPEVHVELVRLVSKICFSIEDDALDGLDVESVRLCQSALKVFPYNDFGGLGSKVGSAADVADGDYASVNDVAMLNAGEPAFFYTMENCHGVLLPGNEDPWEKVPERLGIEADLATYIEVGCSFADEAPYVGNVLYRFYLGRDDCSDFNVVRNNDMHVTLCLTEDGMDKVSWKVEADVEMPGVFLDYVYTPAEYLYQYSCIEFPTADADDPVILEVGGETLTIDGMTSERFFNVHSSDGETHAFFFCVPQAPDKVFFNVWHNREPVVVNLSQGAKSQTLTCSPKGVKLVLKAEGESEADIVRVCESGLKPTYAYVYVADEENGSIIDLEDFLVPDEYAEYMGENPDFIIREASVYLDDVYEKQWKESYVSYSMGVLGLDEGEDYIQGFEFYGLKAGEDGDREVPLSLYDDNVFILPKREVSLIVTPAFPAQGYLGEYVNYQFAPGDLHEEELLIGLPGEAAGGDEVSVTVRRVSLGSLSAAAGQELWDSGYDCDVSAFMSSSRMRLLYHAPDPVEYETVPCGAMIAKASVTNPIDKRVIEGYYLFDLVLYLSVGLQVDISGYELHYSFVPFSEWTLPEYSDFWNDALGGMLYVKATDYYGGGSTERRIQVDVPKSKDEHPLSYTLPQSFSDSGQDDVFDEIASCLLPLKGTLMDFSFYSSPNSVADVLEITRNGASSYPSYADFTDGAKGYYRIVRQQDAGNLIGSHGLENNLVEVAFGSFETY